MMMAMLDAGGVPPVPGSHDRSYEMDDLGAHHRLARANLVGHAVKLLDAVVFPETPIRSDVPWKFIWSDRDGRQQAKSQAKFLRAILAMSVPERQFADSYVRDRPHALAGLLALGDVLELRYELTLASPLQTCRRIADFLAPEFEFDAEIAAKVVHRRDGRCRPDLLFETSGQETMTSTGDGSPSERQEP